GRARMAGGAKLPALRGPARRPPAAAPRPPPAAPSPPSFLAGRAAGRADPLGLAAWSLPTAPAANARRAPRARRGLPPLRRRHRPRLQSPAGRLGALVRTPSDRHPPAPGHHRPSLPDP